MLAKVIARGLGTAAVLGATAAIRFLWTWELSEASAHFLREYPEAVCLDGSPGLYYFRPGSGSGRSKFLIFFEGGGFCSSRDDCADRAKGYLGSTEHDGQTMNLDHHHPFFTSSRQANPLLWNWNHVLVRYCDGAYFSGYRRRPRRVGTSNIFYRGERITAAVFSDLAKYRGLGRAGDVVLGGCSAGAIRVFAHADALRALVPSAHANVVGLPDSGFYLDRSMFTPLKRFVVTEQNATELLNKRCVEDNPGAEERCLISAVVSPYLSTPLFAWQSRYDADQRQCELPPGCARDAACVRAYGEDLSAQVSRNLLANSKNGVFLDSCDRHCAGRKLPVDDASYMTPLQAFAAWYAGGRRVYGQNSSYPCPACCGTWLSSHF
mmetsp:Transcript_74143/g.217576  ORF Transcript_74143/g.217576 Transcript_74143/m.217576 type:complete len:379 (+) Transcript_74143:106-1242(+)